MSDYLRDLENSIGLALEGVEHAKMETVNFNSPEGDGWPLMERLWDELDDIEDRLKALRNDEEFQEALDDEKKYLDDVAAQADAASW
jgi:hypothetical protein